MNDPQALTTVLQDAIGLNRGGQRQAIVNFGFDTCNGLKNTTEDDLKGLFSMIECNNHGLPANRQVRLNLIVKSCLQALRDEFIMRVDCGTEMGLGMLMLLDIPAMDQLVAKHKAWKIAKSAITNVMLPPIDVPTLTKKNWRDFYKAMVETYGRQCGVNAVPLLYVIRANDGDYEARFERTEKQLIACLRHTGENYNTDKEAVYSLLVQHGKDSEIESIVEKHANTRNGRAAWLAVISHMQSTSYMDTLKTDAMSSIKKATYQGEKKDFGITKYYTIHSNAHNDLEKAREPMSDGMKITNFCNGLKDAIAINYAITTKSEVAVTTFEQFYNSFSAKLTSHLTLVNASNNATSRSISSVSHGGRGRGGRGCRRGHGRGRYNPCHKGGHGRGCRRGGRGRGGSSSSSLQFVSM